jgi:hypothetical protein
MHHSLARGYATQFINQQADHVDVEGWFSGRAAQCAFREFGDCAKSKKPARVVKRVSRHTRPSFRNLRIVEWRKELKVLHAEAISSAQESSVFSLSDAEKALYTERSVFYSRVFLIAQGGDVSMHFATLASISHHALTRLFEREVATEDTIGRHMTRILSLSRLLSSWISDSNLDHRKTHSLLLPYAGGALPVVTMEVVPCTGDPKSRARVVAVRTFLDGTMLTRWLTTARMQKTRVTFRTSMPCWITPWKGHLTPEFCVGLKPMPDPLVS